MSVVEHFGSWNGPEIVRSELDGLVPAVQELIMYAGDKLPARRALRVPNVVFPQLQSELQAATPHRTEPRPLAGSIAGGVVHRF